MSKIRINELARQLERKSREVIDKLHELGIAEKVTHSSSIDDDVADKLRRYYAGDGSVRVRSSRDYSDVAAEVDTEGDERSAAPGDDQPSNGNSHASATVSTPPRVS